MQNKTIENINFEALKKCLEGHGYVKYAMLFGSVLKKPRKGSDIDILVGGELDFNNILELSMEIEGLFKKRVDIVPAANAPARLILKAISSGYMILVNDEESFKKDYFKNLHIADDSLGLYRIREERIKRRYVNG